MKYYGHVESFRYWGFLGLFTSWRQKQKLVRNVGIYLPIYTESNF